jgi:hypothetical protein
MAPGTFATDTLDAYRLALTPHVSCPKGSLIHCLELASNYAVKSEVYNVTVSWYACMLSMAPA